jgi:hypothetical protein
MAWLAPPGHTQAEGILEQRCYRLAAPAQPTTGAPGRQRPARDRARPPEGLVIASTHDIDAGEPQSLRIGCPIGEEWLSPRLVLSELATQELVDGLTGAVLVVGPQMPVHVERLHRRGVAEPSLDDLQ